jgi:hypothetical protein
LTDEGQQQAFCGKKIAPNWQTFLLFFICTVTNVLCTLMATLFTRNIF